LKTLSFIFVVLIIGLFSPLSLALDLKKIPFWKVSEGFWLSQNIYLGADLEYKIKQYYSATVIRVSENLVTSTETKFYPAGSFQGKYLGLELDNSRGVEFIQVTKGISLDGTTTLSLTTEGARSSTPTSVSPISDTKAVLTVSDENSGFSLYQMLITYPSPNFRYVLSMGLDSSLENTGALRGLSFFKGKRLDSSAFSSQLSSLREKLNVGTRVYFSKGKYHAETLDR